MKDKGDTLFVLGCFVMAVLVDSFILWKLFQFLLHIGSK